jgi:outer membrane protein
MRHLTTKISVALLAGAMLTAPVLAQEGDWLVRLRGIHVSPSESATITPIGGDVTIDTATVPELDISYFITNNFAIELILATTKHSPQAIGTLAGDVPLGSVYLLPPTVTLQYHPMAGENFSPYVGAGVNYTIFYKEQEPSVTITDINYSNKFGLAAQAGVDIAINNDWFLNADIKKIWLKTDVSMNAGSINADVKINPWIFGIGFGRRF